MWDFRIFHRGLQNTTSNRARPALYSTLAVEWFEDHINVVRKDRSLFSKEAEEGSVVDGWSCLWVRGSYNQIAVMGAALGVVAATLVIVVVFSWKIL